jgi:Enoyl-CoA hydratase/isomerase
MLRVVDLSSAPGAAAYASVGSPPGVIVAHGSAADIAQAESWLDTATFTLTEDPCADRRVVTVDSVPDALAELTRRCQRWAHASSVCDDVLRAVDPRGPTLAGVVTESLAYSTLQAGPEFARWLDERGPARMPDIADPVQAQRDGDTLRIRFNRPQRHNAFSTDARAALLEALTVAQLDPSVTGIVLSGTGPSFCSGGDLEEFGTVGDPATAHAVRLTRHPARWLHLCADRVVVRTHGACLGAGIELASFAGRVVAAPDAFFGLPEVSMGLVPGAGGTVGIPRRIGRPRAVWLTLTGARILPPTALAWGLVDEVER